MCSPAAGASSSPTTHHSQPAIEDDITRNATSLCSSLIGPESIESLMLQGHGSDQPESGKQVPILSFSLNGHQCSLNGLPGTATNNTTSLPSIELNSGIIRHALLLLSGSGGSGGRSDRKEPAQRQAIALCRAILDCKPRRISKQRASLFMKDKCILTTLLSFEEQLARQTNEVLVVRAGDPLLDCLESLYVVLTKVAAADERYGTKLRSCNSKQFCPDNKLTGNPVLTPLVQLRKWSVIKGSGKLTTAILCYVKKVCSSCTNIAALVWGSLQRSSSAQGDVGIVTPLFTILAAHRHTSPTAVAAAELLALVLRSREGILSILEPSRGQMTSLCEHLSVGAQSLVSPANRSTNVNRSLRFTHAIVLCLLHVAYIRPGRQALLNANVLSLVHPLAKRLVLMSRTVNASRSLQNHSQRLLLMVSILIQRCLDPMRLPLDQGANLAHSSHAALPAAVVELTAEAKRDKSGSAREIYADEYFCNSDASDNEEDDESEVTTQASSADRERCSCGHDSTGPNMPPTESEHDNDLSTYAKFFPELKLVSLKKTRKSNLKFGRSKNDKSRLKDCLLCTCADNRSQSSSPTDLVAPEEALVFEEAKSGQKTTPIEPADWRQVYDACAEKVSSFIPVVKQADWLLHEPREKVNALEPLSSDAGDGHWASKLLEHIDKRLFGEQRPISVVVYDLEQDPCQRTRTTLHFESRFESGNLRKAIQTGPFEYTLLLNSDLGTRGHASWFYFEVQNMHTRTEYTFNIINCEKQSGLFNDGMRPLLWSKALFEGGKSGWVRCAGKAGYFRNHYVEEDSLAAVMSGKSFNTLTFSMSFPANADTCYLAYNFPYTFTLLETHLHFWLNSAKLLHSELIFERDNLCETIAGNSVPLLTITSRSALSGPLITYILLMARVHPSETCASWMMKGAIDYLLSERQDAINLRSKFVFKIIPMINLDGVIHGSTRTSLAGDDLNRQWRRPDERSHPEIYHARRLVRWLVQPGSPRRLALICDLHGHSRRKNIFIYGCTPALSWKRSDRTEAACGCAPGANCELILPLMLKEMAPAFSFDDCSFVIEKSREATARVTFWREFGIPLSYTMEASMGACDQGPYAGHHLGIEQLIEMGERFCFSLNSLCLQKVGNERFTAAIPDVLEHRFVERLKNVQEGLESSTSDDSEEIIEP